MKRNESFESREKRERDTGQNRCPKRATEKREVWPRPAVLCLYPYIGGCCGDPIVPSSTSLSAPDLKPPPPECVQWVHRVCPQVLCWGQSSPMRGGNWWKDVPDPHPWKDYSGLCPPHSRSTVSIPEPPSPSTIITPVSLLPSAVLPFSLSTR